MNLSENCRQLPEMKNRASGGAVLFCLRRSLLYRAPNWERAAVFGPDFTASQNWRGQRGPKTNFSNASFIGKTHFIPAFELSLDLFRIIGYEGGKFLSVVPEPC